MTRLEEVDQSNFKGFIGDRDLGKLFVETDVVSKPFVC